jgi:hypothetical protein
MRLKSHTRRVHAQPPMRHISSQADASTHFATRMFEFELLFRAFACDDRYFCTLLSPMTFESFKTKFSRSAKEFNLLSSLTFVAEHYFQGDRSVPNRPRLLILGVDEISKTCLDDFPSQHRRRIDAIVSLIGKTMDQFVASGPSPVVAFPIVTSLSQVAIDRTVTASKRAISWIPLGALTGAASHVVRALGISTTDEMTVGAVEMLCQYVGEHGRLLEILINVLLARDGFLLQQLQLLGPGALANICAFLEADTMVDGYLVRHDAHLSLGYSVKHFALIVRLVFCFLLS